MNANDTIIDVEPIEYSSKRNTSGRSASDARRESTAPGQVHYTSGYTNFGDQATVAQASGSVLGGLAQMAIGAGLVMIGVPMLVLPGPGLLSILGGMALAASGMRKVFGFR